MTIEIVPTLSCPVGCSYCYHEEMWAENPLLRKVDYDIGMMVSGWQKLSALRGGNKEVTFHGGEPLLMPIEDMDELCSKLKAKGANRFGMQTSTYGMNDERIALFKKFQFGLGVSFDGPWYTGCPECFSPLEDLTFKVCSNCGKAVEPFEFDLNRGRGWLAAPQRSKEFANKTVHWIDRLHKEGFGVGTISVVNSYNAGDDKRLGALMKFYTDRPWLNCRYNPVHTEQAQLKFMELSEERLVQVYRQIAERCIDQRANWEPIREWMNSLAGVSINACWHGSDCDPTNSTGATFVTDHGDAMVCPKLGTVFDAPLQIADHPPTPWRVKLLQQIPFEQGGCKGCRYWYLCRGGCESDGIDGDVRNRTRFCRYIYTTLAYLEKRMKDIYPSQLVFPDLPASEQERSLNKIRGWSFDNSVLFGEMVRTKAEGNVEKSTHSKRGRIKVPLTWETPPTA